MRFLNIWLALMLAYTTVSASKMINIPGMDTTGDKKVIIRATITGNTNGKNEVYLMNEVSYRDTTLIKDGRFSFEIPYQTGGTLYLNMEFNPNSGPVILVYDLPGTINLSIDAGTGKTVVSGMETPVAYNEFRGRRSAILRLVNKEMEQKYGPADLKSTDPQYPAFFKDREDLVNEKMIPVLKEQVLKYPDTYATAYIIASYAPNYQLALKEELYNKLGKNAQLSSKGKDLLAMIKGEKNSSIGSTVADFVLNDQNDKEISFARFKGNYLLVDFWASWCVPCRQSFPRMKEVYATFRDQGLQIYSISVDAKKADWLKAVAQEQLPWPQALDTKNISTSGFAVSAIPNLFLIGPDGKIVLKELGFDPQGGGIIEKKLEEIYKNKIDALK